MSELLTVFELPAFDPGEESSVIAAFADLPALTFAQHWKPAPEDRFKPGQVKVGRRDNRLVGQFPAR